MKAERGTLNDRQAVCRSAFIVPRSSFSLWRRLAHAICATLLVVFCAGVVMAMSLETYRKQVIWAIAELDALPEWKKTEGEALYTRRAAELVKQIREKLLTVEPIEWNGTTVNVDNRWLNEALARYEQIPAYDVARRDAELAQTTERLRALVERLTELSDERQGASKAEEKKKLDTILRRSEYSDEPEEGNALERLGRKILEWLRNLFPRRRPLEPGTTSAVSGLSQIIVIALALAVIAYVVWKFTPLFRRKGPGRKREKQEARVVLGERLEPDQTSADLLAEAEALARAGDLRAAIRKGYIALLCELGDRKVIRLAQHKTNRDYLLAVHQNAPLYGPMQQLTYSFENHWYGFVPATETDWHAFRSGFQRAVNSE
jgi:hypothetical protein